MRLTAITSMIIYRSYVSALKSADICPVQRCEFYEKLMDYYETGDIPSFSSNVLTGIFEAIKVTADNNIKKMERYNRATQNGRHGGAPLHNTNAVKNKDGKKKGTASSTKKKTTRKAAPQRSADINERNRIFYETLLPYVEEYGAEMIRDFYEYWVEPTIDMQRLRFETMDAWDLETRLRRWQHRGNTGNVGHSNL